MAYTIWSIRANGIGAIKETAREAAGNGEAALQLKLAQVKKYQIANDRRLGELIPGDELQYVLRQIVRIFSSGMSGLPGRVASVVVGMTDPAEIRSAILKETRAVRSRTADRVTEFASTPERRLTSNDSAEPPRA